MSQEKLRHLSKHHPKKRNVSVRDNSTITRTPYHGRRNSDDAMRTSATFIDTCDNEPPVQIKVWGRWFKAEPPQHHRALQVQNPPEELHVLGGRRKGMYTTSESVEPVKRNPWMLITWHGSGSRQYGNRVVEAVVPPTVQAECHDSVDVTAD